MGGMSPARRTIVEFPNMSSRSKSNNLTKWLVRFGLVGLAAIVVPPILYFCFLGFGGKISDRQDVWGQFGDFVGGVTNPTISFLAYLALLTTIYLQSQMHLREQDWGRYTSLETSFFTLLDTFTRHVDAMDVNVFGYRVSSASLFERNSGQDQTPSVRGKDCFVEIFKHLIEQEYNTSGTVPRDRRHIHDVYIRVYKKYSNDLGHYYRLFYNIVRYVHEYETEDQVRGRLIRLLRAQLSDYELGLLFYNGLSEFGQRLKPLIERYSLLDNLPSEMVLCEEYRQLYHPTAFGKSAP